MAAEAIGQAPSRSRASRLREHRGSEYRRHNVSSEIRPCVREMNYIDYRYVRAHGDDENMASGCSWCHLQGIHGGRIRATGRADCIRWELGPVGCPCLVVNGRERVVA